MKKLTLLIATLVCQFALAQNQPQAQPQAQTPAATNAPSLTEQQIAKILVTINEGEIDAAKMAMKKAQNEEVKNFAKMMEEEHKTNEAETKKLTSRTKILMAESDIAKGLKEEAKKMTEALKKVEKSAFDQSYVAGQIAMHEKALKTLDETLIPNAKNPEMTQHLQRTRVAVAEHLTHAKGLQASTAK